MSSCITCLSFLSGNAFNFLQNDNGMTLEDAPELTKQLWRFLLKTSSVNRKVGKNIFPLLSTEKAFTFGFFFGSVGDQTSPRSVLVIGASIDLKACNRNSFCWGILHMSMTDTLAFNYFKYSTMLYSILDEYHVCMFI
jgi:hypothetical protein